MDTSSHFFSDCLDFDDPNSYQSPEDADGTATDLHDFQPYDGKFDLGGSPTHSDERNLDPNDRRPDVWDGFTQQIGAMDSTQQKALFVDPGLYDPESDNEDIKAQIQVLSMEMSRPSTRRTSSSKSTYQRTSKSGSTSTDITPPDQEPPRKRRARKIKRESNTMEDESKRNKFLERNRIAASKCREKKKMYVSELEETKIGLEAHNANLQLEYNGLLGEVSGLKHHLMTHAKCNDPNIDRWLNNEARRFVQTSNELFGQGFVGFGQGGQPVPTPGSSRSRNPSIASSQFQASMQGVPFDGIGGGGEAERQGSITIFRSGPVCLSTRHCLYMPRLPPVEA